MKSLKALARTLCVPLADLQELAGSAKDHYRQFPVTKKGKTRIITRPKERLRCAQEQIYKTLLRPVELPYHIQGCVPGRSPHSNAEAHLGQPCVVRLDIADFFPSVTPTQVYKVWVEVIGCSPPVASLLTKLTTVNFSLPQGASTSPMLANLVLLNVDKRIRELAIGSDSEFTRFVDDVGLSGSRVRDLIREAAGLLTVEGFKVSRRKIHVMPRTRRQALTGYNLNAQHPSVSREERGKIRAAIHQLHGRTLGGESREKLAASVAGRLQHLRRSNPGAAKRLARLLEKMILGIQPLQSEEVHRGL